MALRGLSDLLLLCAACCCRNAVMLMFITTGWGEDATIAAVISYAIFYGGFGQMVAGVFEVGYQLLGWAELTCIGLEPLLFSDTTVQPQAPRTHGLRRR